MVINTHPQSAILLLNKQHWSSPRRRTWANEPLCLQLPDLLLQLCKFISWHPIRSLSNRASAWYQVNEEFNLPIRGHSWQLIWKHIRIIPHNTHIFQATPLKRINLSLLVLVLGLISDFQPSWCTESDRTTGTVDNTLVLG